MKLIAKKPCSFGGKKFFIGDEVPAQLVLNIPQQTARGILEQVEEEPIAAPAEAEDPPKKAPAKKKGGKKPVEEVGEQ